ncbi:MAG: DUF3459 domain-containing protein, partial [Stellaceae bacterium]
LALRRSDPAFGSQARVDGAVLGDDAWLLRYFADGGDDRLLIVNLGHDRAFEVAAEPLLAPPEDRAWRLCWSSEAPLYGGAGIPDPVADEAWRIPGRAAIVLAADAAEKSPVSPSRGP